MPAHRMVHTDKGIGPNRINEKQKHFSFVLKLLGCA